MTDVFLDEKFIGIAANAKGFIKNVKEGRRKAEVTNILNIGYDKDFDEIYLETLKGRARRPLIIVEEGKSLLTKEHIDQLKNNEIAWQDLIKLGLIEYLDASEEENAYVALSEEELNERHTHLEISPLTILGLCSSLIPYSNFGSSSRLIRGSKIQKQSLGLYTTNFHLRMDTDVSLLHYPQRPITTSFTHNIFEQDEHPAGQNVTIALMSYSGYNMQDAIILNKGAVDRGLFRSTYFRPYTVEELRYSGGLVDEINIPNKEVKGYKSERDYRFLEKDGVGYPGAYLKAGDVIVGKTSPPRFLSDIEEFSIAANLRRESSITVKEGEEGSVDMVIVTENEEGNKLVKVRLRDQRIPEVGDKFASRHGQKGVIGWIVPQEDMPFTSKGVIPDIIFSPHGIPGRMTISHLIEILAGKVGALSGNFIDGTTFDSVPEEELRKQLRELGFRENGTETLYNPFTGEEFEVKIFVGSMYYLKLKHMVANKLHARASGRIQLLTRQPIEGRAKGGGLRLGEMEKDCFVAHGASLLLKERFDSDKTILYVCENCGMIAIYDSFRNTKICPKCGNTTEISAVELSYAFKLLVDELKSLCINIELNLANKY